MNRMMAALAATAVLSVVIAVPASAHRGSEKVTTLRLDVHSAGRGAGSTVRIDAQLKNVPKALRSATFSASAVIHFSDGDVTVPLTRKGSSTSFKAKVPVSAGNTSASVAVDVSITGNGVTWTGSRMVKVKAAKTSASPSESADPSASTKPSHKPEPSESAEPSESPDPSASADPSHSPEPSESADPGHGGNGGGSRP